MSWLTKTPNLEVSGIISRVPKAKKDGYVNLTSSYLGYFIIHRVKTCDDQFIYKDGPKLIYTTLLLIARADLKIHSEQSAASLSLWPTLSLFVSTLVSGKFSTLLVYNSETDKFCDLRGVSHTNACLLVPVVTYINSQLSISG